MKISPSVILGVVIAILVWLSFNLGIQAYKHSCEVIGDAQGQKWRECEL